MTDSKKYCATTEEVEDDVKTEAIDELIPDVDVVVDGVLGDTPKPDTIYKTEIDSKGQLTFKTQPQTLQQVADTQPLPVQAIKESSITGINKIITVLESYSNDPQCVLAVGKLKGAIKRLVPQDTTSQQ